jgi:hypothetical protein
MHSIFSYRKSGELISESDWSLLDGRQQQQLITFLFANLI